MVSMTYTPAWVSDSFFNEANQLHGTITKAEIVEKDNGKEELILTIDAGDYGKCRMSIWGKNSSYLAKKVGNGEIYETDKLISKKVTVTQTVTDGKKVRALVLE